MNRADWLEVAALVADLWPNQEWSRETIASSFALVSDFSISPKVALQAVRDIALDGRQFVPPPGVVAAHIKAAGPGEGSHLLVAPDITRDLTPEEQARAIEMAARIKERIAELAKAHELAQVKS